MRLIEPHPGPNHKIIEGGEWQTMMALVLREPFALHSPTYFEQTHTRREVPAKQVSAWIEK